MENRSFLFASKVLNRDVPVRLLVPSASNMKCLILLHGYNGTQDQWYEKTTIEELAAQYNLIVAMPGCGNGYYEDTQEDIPRFIGEELVSFIRSSYPVSQEQKDMYISGVSMGGFGALLIGAKYWKIFGKIASLSGAFIIPDVVIGNQGVLGDADPDYFKAIFGDFENLEGSSRDPVAEAIRHIKGKNKPSICMLCGTEDVLYQGNLKVVKVLRKNDIPVLWYGGKGNHRWPFWNDMLPYVIKWLLDDFVPEGVDDGYITSDN